MVKFLGMSERSGLERHSCPPLGLAVGRISLCRVGWAWSLGECYMGPPPCTGGEDAVYSGHPPEHEVILINEII
jgi:hypothetical protein